MSYACVCKTKKKKNVFEHIVPRGCFCRVVHQFNTETHTVRYSAFACIHTHTNSHIERLRRRWSTKQSISEWQAATRWGIQKEIFSYGTAFFEMRRSTWNMTNIRFKLETFVFFFLSRRRLWNTPGDDVVCKCVACVMMIITLLVCNGWWYTSIFNNIMWENSEFIMACVRLAVCVYMCMLWCGYTMLHVIAVRQDTPRKHDIIYY